MKPRFATCATLLFALALGACDGGGGSDDSGGGDDCAALPVDGCPGVRAATVASVQDVGFVGKPTKVAGRDGAQTAVLGGRLLWVFGDTFFGTQSVDGYNYRTATATLADPAAPLATTEPLDANGIPYAAIPWTNDELAYNAASGSGSDRVALWNAGLVADPARTSLLGFYEKLYTQPTGWQAQGIGTIRFAPGQTVGTRTAGLLFDRAKGEPLFKHALLHDGMVYLYGNLASGAGGVARAPLERATERIAYTFWDGNGWSADVAKAAPMTGNAPGSLSVAWNAYLGRFVGVYSQTLDTRMLVRTAPRPEGPWSAPTLLFATREGPSGNRVTYAGTQHPALAQDGGQTIAVSYSLPTDCFLCGEVVLVRVTFQ